MSQKFDREKLGSFNILLKEGDKVTIDVLFVTKRTKIPRNFIEKLLDEPKTYLIEPEGIIFKITGSANAHTYDIKLEGKKIDKFLNTTFMLEGFKYKAKDKSKNKGHKLTYNKISKCYDIIISPAGSNNELSREYTYSTYKRYTLPISIERSILADISSSY